MEARSARTPLNRGRALVCVGACAASLSATIEIIQFPVDPPGGTFGFSKLVLRPFPINLAKNGFRPQKGGGLSVKDGLQKIFGGEQAFAFGCSHWRDEGLLQRRRSIQNDSGPPQGHRCCFAGTLHPMRYGQTERVP
jgi:hypothetical protein